MLAAIALGRFTSRLSRAWRSGGEAAGLRSGLRAWMVLALALIGLYVGQELLEGMLSTGHPGALTGVLGAGGWTALPLAVAIGGLGRRDDP